MDRIDPENRPFCHSDPIRWTSQHRGKILQAMYTVLIANPVLYKFTGSNTPSSKTRYKEWYWLIGSAIENAVAVSSGHLDFQYLFLAQEEDEEEAADWSDALAAMAETEWAKPGKEFAASDVMKLANELIGEYTGEDQRRRIATVREVLYPNEHRNFDREPVSDKSVGKRLGLHLGEPVRHGDNVLTLKARRDTHRGPKGRLSYWIEKSQLPSARRIGG